MAWILTASGAVASYPPGASAPVLRCEQSPQARLERPDVIDGRTGARLVVTRRTDGAAQASITWQDLNLRKVVHPNGDFNVRLSGRQDLVLLVRTGNRLRVSRNGASETVTLGQADEDGLDGAQQVLAGSKAVRQFRALRNRLDESSLATAPGVALDLVDVLLGILQGDAQVLGARNAPAAGRLARVSALAAATCYAEYETEVCSAWNDFSQCVDDVSWFPGLQEACALTWLLRVESAWFRFIGCSSFPLRAE